MSSRAKKLKINMVASLMYEVVVVICGMILPRVVLSYFGSTYNGIVNSITQFMGFSIVFRSGLGAVTNAALYKPLADNDVVAVSEIMVATKKFMNKVGVMLIAFIVGFAGIYSFIVMDEFSYMFTFSLVLIIGASVFVENMFSIKYKILLQADQKYYIQTIAAMIAQLLSTAFSVILIVTGFGIHVVRAGAVLGLMTTPFILKIYVDRHYDVDWNASPNNSAIKSRWDAFAQQLASVVNNNVPTIIMTLMLPMKEISVYSVYNLVAYNIRQLLTSFLSSMKATFGNMIARNETETLRKRFSDVEFVVFTACTIIFTTAAIMLTPFVLVYTKDITDADYNQYWLGIFLVVVSMMSVVRVPYQLLVEAAGIFKETRNGAFLEIVLNVVFSAIFGYLFGVIGVVAGCLVATVVRTIQFVIVSCRRVLGISVLSVVKKYVFFFAIHISIIALAYCFDDWFYCTSLIKWVFVAACVFCIVTLMVLLLDLVFNFKQTRSSIMYFIKRGKKNVR